MIKNFARIGRFPTGVGPRAPKKPVIEIAPAPVVDIATVLRVEDIPFEVPRGTARPIDPPQEGEDPGYTPEVVEEDAPIRTKPLSAPERPKPTFMGNRPAATEVAPERASPPPVRPTLTPAGAPPVRRAGFLPRKVAAPDGTAPAADAAEPVGGFAGLLRKIAAPVAKAAPAPKPADPALDFVRFPTNGKFMVPDDIPF
jgi:hypothetical protein